MAAFCYYSGSIIGLKWQIKEQGLNRCLSLGKEAGSGEREAKGGKLGAESRGNKKSSAIILLSIRQLEWVAEDFYLFYFSWLFGLRWAVRARIGTAAIPQELGCNYSALPQPFAAKSPLSR